MLFLHLPWRVPRGQGELPLITFVLTRLVYATYYYSRTAQRKDTRKGEMEGERESLISKHY